MTRPITRSLKHLTGALALVTLAACSSIGVDNSTLNKVSMGMLGGVKLTGDQEVPPVTTSATGTGEISIASDGSVSGSIKNTGIDGTMAHIHLGAVGKNGPVIVPLTKTADNTWSVPAGAKLSAEQLKSYQAGDLYVNVHSAANKAGEIRAQLKP